MESLEYLQDQIITYIGNKRNIIEKMEDAVTKVKVNLGKQILRTADIFSGSGIVSRFLRQHSYQLFANDLEPFTLNINKCYLYNTDILTYSGIISFYNELQEYLKKNWNPDGGFITELYSPRDTNNPQRGERCFYTRENALFIDNYRQAIDKVVNDIYKPYFIAPLLYQASVNVNTSGIFKGFHKDENGVGKFGGRGENALSRIKGEMKIMLPVLPLMLLDHVSVSNVSAIDWAEKSKDMDLVYLDPPYNQHPYGSNYFMLNLISNYQRPNIISDVSGIPTEWNRSNFNKKKFTKKELFDVIDTLDTKFILLSYNSEGFISYDELIEEISNRKFNFKQYDIDYPVYKGSRNLKNRSKKLKEYLFLIKK